VTFVVLSSGYGMEDQRAAWIAISSRRCWRLLAIRFNWTTRSVKDWRRRRDGS